MKYAKQLLFVLLFTALVFIGKQINFSALVGAESQFFTLFQFFGPIAGGFLGPFAGMATVFLSQITEIFIFGKELQWLTVLRFLPMVFAAFYFSRKTEHNLLKVMIPLLCIILFIAHPIGRQVWFYSLFWLIPIIAVIVPKKWPGQLLLRSYGATFMAHAVGGAIWIYSVPMTAAQWLALIPVTAYERFLFGLGIAGSFVVATTILNYAVEKWELPLQVEKQYALFK